ncbi:molybdenum cofactor guanylyltransferase [Paenibacillus sp. 598K]|uniref:molybdenum cofactor guanylyltransferase n=1 Tax=Paenibacillus sp. 598K TaxID=1117987 RepID=UPI000FF9CA9C|nr:molybdenum cofactor guanylyltransferase [Paenibacillus sp. 598K]GBF74562.1 molybdenum cofactor guanylyltransferase [Paenibacillus sp. 598K]
MVANRMDATAAKAKESSLGYGIIIAGGLSRRMGTDKALLPVGAPPWREPMLAHIARQMLPWCDRLLIAAGDEARAARYREALAEAAGEGCEEQLERGPSPSDDSAVDANHRGAVEPGERANYGHPAGADASWSLAMADIGWVVDRYAGGGPLAGVHAALAAVAAQQLRAGGSGLGEYGLVMACDMPRICPSLLQRMLDAARDTQADIVCVAGQPFHALYHARTARTIGEMLAADERRLMQLLNRAHAVHIEPMAEERLIFTPLNTPDAYRKYLY